MSVDADLLLKRALEYAEVLSRPKRFVGPVEWDPRDHPRERTGRFRRVLDAMNPGDVVLLPGGTSVTRSESSEGKLHWEIENDEGIPKRGGSVAIEIASELGKVQKLAFDAEAASSNPNSLGGGTSYPSYSRFAQLEKKPNPQWDDLQPRDPIPDKLRSALPSRLRDDDWHVEAIDKNIVMLTDSRGEKVHIRKQEAVEALSAEPVVEAVPEELSEAGPEMPGYSGGHWVQNPTTGEYYSVPGRIGPGEAAVTPPASGLEYITPDEVAETLDGISQQTGLRLWDLLSQTEQEGTAAPIGGERHDPYGEFGTPMVEDPYSRRDLISEERGSVVAVWDRLTEAERQEINAAMARQDERYERERHHYESSAMTLDEPAPDVAAMWDETLGYVQGMEPESSAAVPPAVGPSFQANVGRVNDLLPPGLHAIPENPMQDAAWEHARVVLEEQGEFTNWSDPEDLSAIALRVAEATESMWHGTGSVYGNREGWPGHMADADPQIPVPEAVNPHLEGLDITAVDLEPFWREAWEAESAFLESEALGSGEWRSEPSIDAVGARIADALRSIYR